MVWAAACILLHSRRQWLLYYICASFGLATFIVYGAIQADLHCALSGMEMDHTSRMLNWMGIASYVRETVLYIPTSSTWVVMECSLERSALMEITVIACLLTFYVGFSFPRRFVSVIAGTIATYCANILGMLTIAVILNRYGSGYEYFAHSVVARMIFFVFVLIIYWYLITRPTIRIIHDSLEKIKQRSGDTQ